MPNESCIVVTASATDVAVRWAWRRQKEAQGTGTGGTALQFLPPADPYATNQPAPSYMSTSRWGGAS